MPLLDEQLAEEKRGAIAQQARRWYAERLACGKDAQAWWDVVAITASSKRQAERYEWEIERRRKRGHIPAGVRFVVVPDPGDRRVGSGGATIHALAEIAPPGVDWWKSHRVLLIHCGGDSRRLPQYSLSGKLFSALPAKTSWGEASTVFDETLALSSAWARESSGGLVVGSGDVVLTFSADRLQWNRPGVCGVALRQPAVTGMQHGVYVADEKGRVYAFLQKPSMEALRAAGALLAGDEVALDIGLLHFAPETAAQLRDIELPPDTPPIDLYHHVTMALTGQWAPQPNDGASFQSLAKVLEGTPFWCSLVEGEFIHIGTTTLLRDLMTGGIPAQRAMAGVAIDCVLRKDAQPAYGSLLIECNLTGPLEAGRGCVLHGLEGISGAIEAPDDTVLHQVPVLLADGRKGTVIRAYGVGDDPKSPAAAWKATWFGRPMIEELHGLGIDLAKVWPGLGPEQWTLWNAQLFPVFPTADDAWACARWMMRLAGRFSAAEWEKYDHLSLETSTQLADVVAIEASLSRRLQANWCSAAVALAEGDADIRPMLAHSPGVSALAEAGRRLEASGAEVEASSPSEAASRYFQAGMFLAQAGLEEDAGSARERSFRLVDQAVRMGSGSGSAVPCEGPRTAAWQKEQASVAAPVRIDLGGGWSDTPPFCLDWGGTVLNLAVELNGLYPIRTVVRRIDALVIRCFSCEDGTGEEYRESADLLRQTHPGDPFLLVRTALRMTGLFDEAAPLAKTLEQMGGGIEIRTEADVPMGSGLGSSSILAATTLWALAEITGERLETQELSDRAMRLEQLMTTGGGWQDQAGGIFPGAKLVSSGPGMRQRLRVQPVGWRREHEEELQELMVLYYTGIRRIAKELLRQVVGRYLARETGAVQVLHSIKTLAMEMSFALQEGNWDYLGQLLDRHWELNQVLDPNTTNAPINALLTMTRPYIRGAKLAGAGGGGFMMLLARSREAAGELREMLSEQSRVEGGAVYDWQLSTQGPRIEI
jgi:fucokinase